MLRNLLLSCLLLTGCATLFSSTRVCDHNHNAVSLTVKEYPPYLEPRSTTGEFPFPSHPFMTYPKTTVFVTIHNGYNYNVKVVLMCYAAQGDDEKSEFRVDKMVGAYQEKDIPFYLNPSVKFSCEIADLVKDL